MGGELTEKQPKKNLEKWVSTVIHGTNAERLVVANHKCTKNASSNLVALHPTLKSVPSVSTTATLAGLAKESLKPQESLTLFTTLLQTNLSELKLLLKVLLL